MQSTCASEVCFVKSWMRMRFRRMCVAGSDVWYGLEIQFMPSSLSFGPTFDDSVRDAVRPRMKNCCI